MPTANYFGGSCVLDESVLHAGTMFGPAGATSACSLALVHLALGWPYILSFWSFYSHTRPVERQRMLMAGIITSAGRFAVDWECVQ